MDAFVVRTKRNSPNVNQSSIKTPKGRQRTLFNLKGVVVLEDLESAVEKLNNLEIEKEEKLKILKKLSAKQPSTQIIISTGIGKTIKKLTKSSDSELANAAQLVKSNWKSLVERRVELSLGNKTEVATDLETQTIREKARALFFKSYREVKLETLQNLEKKFFSHFKPCIGVRYRRAIRKVASNTSAYLDLIKADQLDAVVAKASSR